MKEEISLAAKTAGLFLFVSVISGIKDYFQTFWSKFMKNKISN